MGPDFWNWCRFRALTAKPAAAGANGHFLAAFGNAAEVAGPLQPINGYGVVFDPTLGFDQWVLRAWRGGVAIQLNLGITFDALLHTVLLKHRGAAGIEAWVGDPRRGIPLGLVGTLTGAEIQPAASVQGFYSLIHQLDPALAFNPAMEFDFWGMGSPG